MRSSWAMLLVSLVGCAPLARPFSGAEALANLRTQAIGVERAMIQEDHQRMADLTHPALIDHFGGRANYVKELEKTAADLHRQGLKFLGFRFGNPSQLFESADVLYVIYPYSLEFTGPNNEPASQPGYLLGTSDDKGVTWKFLDGAGVGSDQSRLKQFLPGFPAELNLPEPGPLIVHH